ncbi:MAG: HlyD family secretion protein, partial [Pseudomonadales bacterium]|nr:HlyD family secretion protein [Pseudomonadales bacterium]
MAELDNRLGIESRRLDVLADSADEQLSAQRTQVERLRSIVRFNEERTAALTVRAGIDGVLGESAVEEGQWINAGDTMGRVVQPGRLKAELRLPQNRGGDLAIGQAAQIDTRNGVIDGSVSRIDPTVRDGTITVDVSLSSDLPAGARPNMSVDGTVVLERLNDITYVGRP